MYVVFSGRFGGTGANVEGGGSGASVSHSFSPRPVLHGADVEQSDGRHRVRIALVRPIALRL